MFEFSEQSYTFAPDEKCILTVHYGWGWQRAAAVRGMPEEILLPREVSAKTSLETKPKITIQHSEVIISDIALKIWVISDHLKTSTLLKSDKLGLSNLS